MSATLSIDDVATVVAQTFRDAVGPALGRIAALNEEIAALRAAVDQQVKAEAIVELVRREIAAGTDHKAIVAEVVAAQPPAAVPEPADPALVAQHLGPIVAAAVSAAVAAIPAPPALDMDAVRQIITDEVSRIEPRQVDPTELDRLVQHHVAQVPPPPAPRDGRDAEPELIRAMVAEAVAALPVPRDGVDGESVSMEAVEAMVRNAVAVIPAPRDGIDAEPVDPAEIQAMVQQAVAALPVPRDGKDADPDLIRSIVAEAVAQIEPAQVDPDLVRGMVAEAVAAIPAPRDGTDGTNGTNGTNGKDADPEQIRAMVAEAVAALPPARDGKDADMEQIRAMVAEQVAQIPLAKDGEDADPEYVRILVDAAVAKIPVPRDGKDADPEQVRAMVQEAVALIPVPKDGEPGRDADPEQIKALVLEAVAQIPTPKDGEPGRDADPEQIKALVAEAVAQIPPARDGNDGEPGPAGKDVDVDDVRAWISEAVTPKAEIERMVRDVVAQQDHSATIAIANGYTDEAVVAAIAGLPPAEVPHDVIRAAAAEAVAALPPVEPVPVDQDMVARLVEDAVTRSVAALPPPAAGKDGADGVGAAGALIDRDGHLCLTLSDGSVARLGQVVGQSVDIADVARMVRDEVAQIPRPADGLGYDDLSVLFDGERTFTFRFARGTETREFPFTMAAMIYRGIWREPPADQPYRKGDVVTWNGSAWHAWEDTSEKPGTSKAWQQAVKKGRDANAPVAAVPRDPNAPVRPV